MKMYSALVYRRDGQLVFIRDIEVQSKAAFIHDLRHNGYRVNPRRVKPSEVFDYILDHTDCNPWDWDLKEVPCNE